MGLSAADDTLPYKLHLSGLTDTKMFALCYRTGGGIVTLGGVDLALHEPEAHPDDAQLSNSNRTGNGGLYFAQMLKPKG